MVKAIRMPDLHQFEPGFFDLSARCGGWELEHLIIVREAFFPHGCLRLWQGSVAEAGDWLHFRMVPVPLLATVSRRIRSEEHTSELQSRLHLVCRLLLEKKKKKQKYTTSSIDISAIAVGAPERADSA